MSFKKAAVKQTALFIHISPLLSAPFDKGRNYIEEIYPKLPGYHVASKHFVEVPTWVANVAGKLNPKFWDTKFFVFTGNGGPEKFHPDVVFASAMDTNKHILHDLAQFNPDLHFVIGGYIEPAYFANLSNVTWVNSPDELGQVLSHVNPLGGPNYSLFAGIKCLPRLRLSSGRLHGCSFCTIARTRVLPRNEEEIWQEVYSFSPLSFELIYLDDKTFGQASNVGLLADIYTAIRTYNPKFQGFVVQTTALEAVAHADYWVEELHVKYIEIGVEAYDDDILTQWHKPHKIAQIDKATEKLAELQQAGKLWGFIPNIIFGVGPHSDGTPYSYAPTVAYIEKWAKTGLIVALNLFILSVYLNSKDIDTIVSGHTAQLGDELESSLAKSWLTIEEQVLASQYMDYLADLTLGYVK